MNQPTETETETETALQSFLTRLASIAEAGGDVVQAVRSGDVKPPPNVPEITHGSTGETIYQKRTV